MPDLGTIDLATVEASVFKPHLDSEFTLRGQDGGEEIGVTLVQVASYPDYRGAGESRRRPFGLVFHCGSSVLKQGTYTLSHPSLPGMDIFLSPFEGGAGWCKLEAIFN